MKLTLYIEYFYSIFCSTVPPETTYPFAAVLPRSNCRLILRSHLGIDAACREKSPVLPVFFAASNTAVIGETR